MKLIPTLIACYFICVCGFSQEKGTAQKMDFEKYDPVSTLMVPGTIVSHAKFPYIDVHNHQWGMPMQDLSKLITDMDMLNMKVMVNLSGGSGDNIIKGIANVKAGFPNRLIIFANI